MRRAAAVGAGAGILRGIAMEYALPEDRMPEAEVTLRLAFHLLELAGSQGVAEAAIDGAQVKVHGAEIFPIVPFLADTGWKQVEQIGKNDWQGWYEKEEQRLRIDARPGVGDVVVAVGSKRIRAECKGGPLIKKRGSPEYRILRGALGQVITVEQVSANDILVVAIPHTPRFRKLADKWRERPLVVRSGIQIVLVDRDGTVEWLDPLTEEGRRNEEDQNEQGERKAGDETQALA
jgi:hypothetical protein